MEIVIAMAVILLLLGLMICVLLKKRKRFECDSYNGVVLMLSLNLVLIFAGIVIDGVSGPRLTFNLVYSLVFTSVSVFQIFEGVSVKYVAICAGTGILGMVIHHILALSNVVAAVSSSGLISVSFGLMIMYSLVIVVRTHKRLLNINVVIKSGAAVWSYVWLCSDCVYLLVIASIVMCLFLLSDILDLYEGAHVAFVNVILSFTLAGLYLRKMRNSPFIFRKKYERVLLESIKVLNLEVAKTSLGDDSGYRVVYDRVRNYFETERPFLRSDLTINDLVSAIYSNKLYISRAISLCTGRNFRQFVNYYRVRYSCDMFRENPSMKIVELSQACGFNTVASFNMAFRLFMNETPGEWCRKEKVRLLSLSSDSDKVIDKDEESIDGK